MYINYSPVFMNALLLVLFSSCSLVASSKSIFSVCLGSFRFVIVSFRFAPMSISSIVKVWIILSAERIVNSEPILFLRPWFVIKISRSM